MSIDCRYFTNGTKTAYTLKHTDTGLVEEFPKFEDIPAEVRDHFKRRKACGHPDYQGKRCIAESCKYAEAGGWEKCPYFTK